MRLPCHCAPCNDGAGKNSNPPNPLFERRKLISIRIFPYHLVLKISMRVYHEIPFSTESPIYQPHPLTIGKMKGILIFSTNWQKDILN